MSEGRTFTTDWSTLEKYFKQLKKIEQWDGKCACSLSTLETGWRIAHKLEASLDYVASLCLKTSTTNPNNKKS